MGGTVMLGKYSSFQSNLLHLPLGHVGGAVACSLAQHGGWGSCRAGDGELLGGSNLLPLSGTLHFKWGMGVNSASLKRT